MSGLLKAVAVVATISLLASCAAHTTETADTDEKQVAEALTLITIPEPATTVAGFVILATVAGVVTYRMVTSGSSAPATADDPPNENGCSHQCKEVLKCSGYNWRTDGKFGYCECTGCP